MMNDKCCTCKHSFTTGKDRLYCKKSLAYKDICGEYEMEEETREMLTADERALFLNKLTHWLKDNFNDIVIGGWQDTDGEIFDLFFIRRR